MYGDEGNDSLFGESGDDRLEGGFGNDYLSGGIGNDRLFGQEGNDILTGDIGNDSLYGGVGNDSLFGGDGNDLIDPENVISSELDTLTGGGGRDLFVLSNLISGQGSGSALITDFVVAEDRISLRGTRTQYSLHAINKAGTSALDTGIYRLFNGGSSLIGVVQDIAPTSLIPQNFTYI
ncbi:calcium-binding protein [Microseira wollei]|uniref:calcium-binding protein n=1 Tax=Microseira wollei TaxID=467598 RepID=UPI0040394FB0